MSKPAAVVAFTAGVIAGVWLEWKVRTWTHAKSSMT